MANFKGNSDDYCPICSEGFDYYEFYGIPTYVCSFCAFIGFNFETDMDEDGLRGAVENVIELKGK